MHGPTSLCSWGVSLEGPTHRRRRASPFYFLSCSLRPLVSVWASLVAQMVKNLPAMRETWLWSLAGEDPLEEGMATHSSILARRILWTEERLWATVHGVAKSWTQLSNLRFWSCFKPCFKVMLVRAGQTESILSCRFFPKINPSLYLRQFMGCLPLPGNLRTLLFR